MKADQVFGVLLILLAIYLGVTAAGGGTGGGLFGGGGTIEVAPGTGGGGASGGSGSGASGDGSASGGSGSGTSGDGSASGGSGSGTSGDGSASGGSGSGTSGDDTGEGQQAASRERIVTTSRFCAASTDSSRWEDVGPRHDAAVRCMETAKVVTGASATRFEPNGAVTRGQTAAAIAAMIEAAQRLAVEGVELCPSAGGECLPPAEDARFSDVPPDSPHELAIARLNETPILQGYVDARFEPRGRVTRAQMASLLDRSYQYLNGSALPAGRDRFRDDDRSVHEDSINAVAAAQIMHGVGNRRFAPERSVTRGELAAYLTRIMIRMEDKGRIAPL